MSNLLRVSAIIVNRKELVKLQVYIILVYDINGSILYIVGNQSRSHRILGRVTF